MINCDSPRESREKGERTGTHAMTRHAKHPDIMEDLQKQVASLTNIVAELTEFKAKQTLRPTPSTSSLYFSDSDTFCDSLISGIIDQEPVAAVDQCRLLPDQSVNLAVPFQLQTNSLLP